MNRFKALSGAAISAALLLSACNTAETKAVGTSEPGGTDKTVVATVNGTSIYFSDVVQAARLTGQIGPQDTLERGGLIYEGLVPELVNQRLLAQEAQASGLADTQTARHRIDVAKERILANMALEDYLKTAASEDAARALYDEQIKLRQTGQEARASHILVDTEDEAKAAAKRLAGGEDFAAVATDISIDRGTQTQGGDLGWFQADAMVADFSKAVFALKDGETSAPFQTQFGWHIAKLTGKRAAPVPSFEQMEGEITNYLSLREIDKYTKALREDAQIERVAPDVIEPEAAPEPDPNSESQNE